MAGVECQFNIPEVPGLESGKITVGRHIVADCRGEIPQDFDFANAKMSGENNVIVKTFVVRKSAEDALQFDFTIYKADKFQISEYSLQDGKNTLTLAGSPLQVESVVKAAGGEPPKPFGSIFPIPIGIPLSYFAAVGLVVLGVALAIFLGIRTRNYERRLRIKFMQYDSPIDPQTQFYKAIRAAEKLSYPFENLEEAIRTYAIRAYRLPLFEIDTAAALRHFKKRFPSQRSARADMERIFGELEELKKNKEQLQPSDRQELVRKLYRFVDHNPGVRK